MTFEALVRLSGMRHEATLPRRPETGRVRPRRVLLWITLIVGFLVLSFAAAIRADAERLPGVATRRQAFSASGPLRSLSVQNLNGSLEITAGKAFQATVELTAHAASDREAQRLLDETECRFDNADGDMALIVEAPGVRIRRTRGGWDVRAHREEGGRVEARAVVTLPPEVRVDASLVNGAISTKGITAGLKLSTVNGKIEVAGARQDLKLHTVNGSIDAALAELPKDARVEAQAVNGNLLLKLPATAGFRLDGRTMSGEILSTFPFPQKAADEEKLRKDKEKIRVEKEKIRADQEKIREAAREREREARRAAGDGGEHVVIDLSDLNETLAQLNVELADLSREVSRTVVLNLNRSFTGTVGDGRALVHLSNLSGRIVVLAEGTTEAQAKPLVGARTAHIVEIPPIPPIPPIPAVPPVPPIPPIPPVPPVPPIPAGFGQPVVRGDVGGDFVATDVQGDVTLGHVAGKVKVATHWGQIRVASAGKGADLSTAGGEIDVESVTGDLSASTLGGDIRAGRVSGDVRLETTGGDIELKSGARRVTARTSGGDITLRRVRGPVVARTTGGTVFCEVLSVERPGVDVSSDGGDVTLVLPANVHGDVDVRVDGVDPEGDYVVSQFPELSVIKRDGEQRAVGKLGGGGARIAVRSVSGTIRIRKGPAAP